MKVCMPHLRRVFFRRATMYYIHVDSYIGARLDPFSGIAPPPTYVHNCLNCLGRNGIFGRGLA